MYLAGRESQAQTLQGDPGLTTVWAGQKKMSSLNTSEYSKHVEYPEGRVLLSFQADPAKIAEGSRGTSITREPPPLGTYRKKGTSLIRNGLLLGPYSRPMPRTLRWPWGGEALAYERMSSVFASWLDQTSRLYRDASPIMAVGGDTWDLKSYSLGLMLCLLLHLVHKCSRFCGAPKWVIPSPRLGARRQRESVAFL